MTANDLSRPAPRAASKQRRTKETEVAARLALDGSGEASIATGMGFMDHMLELFTHHGRFDLELSAKGDLDVDYHHTVEDVGLVLGECLLDSLGDKSGVARFGTSYVPLDEALSRVVVDLSGRPYLRFDVSFPTERVGSFPTELFEDFFRALTDRARITVHIERIHGRNSHHIAETIFKAFARALARACEPLEGEEIVSTKGTLSE